MEPLFHLSPLFVVYYATLIFALLAGLLAVPSSKLFYRLVVAQLLAATIADGAATYMHYWLHVNDNVGVLNIYILAEFILYTLAACSLFFKKAGRTAILTATGIILLYLLLWGICIVNSSMGIFASLAYIIGGIIISLLFVLILFGYSYGRGEAGLSVSIKWFCTATLLYYCCDIPFFSLLLYLNKHNSQLAARLYGINDVLNTVRYSMIGVSFLLYRSNRNNMIKPSVYDGQ